MVRSFSHCRAKSDAATHLLNLRAVLPKFNVCGVTLCLFPVECFFRDAHGFRVCWLTYFRKCFGSWFSQGRCFNILFRMCGRWRRLWRSVMKVSSWRCVSKTFDSDIGSPPVIRAKGVFVKLRGSRLERHEPGTASRDSSVGVLAIRTSDQGKRQHLLQANTC